MAPLLLLLLETGGATPEQAVIGAVATSTAAILFTSIPSVTVHAWHKLVNWSQLKWIFPAAVVGALLSTQLARLFPATVLVSILAVFLGQSGWQVLHSKQPVPGAPGATGKLPPGQLLGVGLGAGLMGPLTGTGGGVVVSAMLVRLRQPLTKAIGTSAGATFFVAVAGTLGFSGTGAINTTILLYLAPSCAVMAAVGARLVNVLSRRRLQMAYATCMLLISLRLCYWLLTHLWEG